MKINGPLKDAPADESRAYCKGAGTYSSEQNAVKHLQRRHFGPKQERGGPAVLIYLSSLPVAAM